MPTSYLKIQNLNGFSDWHTNLRVFYFTRHTKFRFVRKRIEWKIKTKRNSQLYRKTVDVNDVGIWILRKKFV